MKTPLLTILFLVLTKLLSAQVAIPDTAFRNYIQSFSYRAIVGTELDTTNPIITSFEKISIGSPNMKDLEGIQYFKNLKDLNVFYHISHLPVLPPGLKKLQMGFNGDTLNIQGQSLEELVIYSDSIKYIAALPSSLRQLRISGKNPLKQIVVNDSLERLVLWGNTKLDSIDVSGNKMNTLEFFGCRINYIKNLPSQLKMLNIGSCYVPSVDNLPSSLEVLSMYYDTVFSFNLNPSLKYFRVTDCNLTTLPLLPSGLEYLNCGRNLIDSVLNLPPGLDTLICGNDSLRYFEFPDSLSVLSISGSDSITEIASLKKLRSFDCSRTGITCLPKLNDELEVIGTSLSCIPNYPPLLIANIPLCTGKFSYIENISPACDDDSLICLASATSYLWNTGDTTNYLDSACRGIYSCETVDTKNCYLKGTVNLNGALSVNVIPDYDCVGCINNARTEVTGGTPPYTFQWGTIPPNNIHPYTTQNIGHECGQCDNYFDVFCLVTDANGDTMSGSFSLNPPDESYGASGEWENNSVTCPKSKDGIVQESVPCPCAPCHITLYWETGLGVGTVGYDPMNPCTNEMAIIHMVSQSDVCYRTNVTLPDCNGSMGRVRPYSTSPNVCYVNVTDTSRLNWYDPDYLPNNNMFICEYIIEDGHNNAVVVGIDTVVFLDSACAFVWPGDANNNGVADNVDLLYVGFSLQYMEVGRYNPSELWTPQVAADWINYILPGNVNAKHADCNGDGIVTESDTNAIVMNFGQTHSRNTFPQAIAGVEAVTIDFPDIVKEGVTNVADVILGDSTTATQWTYGVAFNVSYDPSLIDPSSVMFQLDSSWLGESNSMMMIQHNDATGNLSIGITRKDFSDRAGCGRIGSLYFKPLISGSSVLFSTSDVVKSQSWGEVVPLNGSVDSVFVSGCDVTSVAVNNSCTSWCNASITITTTGFVGTEHYDWNMFQGDSTHCIPVFNNTYFAGNLPTGLYNCIITDTTGCADTVSVNAYSDSVSLTVTAIYLRESCTACDGYLHLNVTGGNMPYIYDWSNSWTFPAGYNMNSKDLDTLCLDGLDLNSIITDAGGCTVEYNDVFIDDNCYPSVLVEQVEPACEGDGNGSACLGYSPSSLVDCYPLSVFWEGHAPCMDPSACCLNSISAGDYNFITISSSGCDTSVYPVTVPEVIYNISLQTTPEVCGMCNGTAVMLINGNPVSNVDWMHSDFSFTADMDSVICMGDTVYYSWYDGTCTVGGEYISDSCLVSVDDYISLQNIRLMPNPNSGIFILTLPVGYKEYELEILNYQGQEVHHQFIKTASSSIEMDLADFAKGIYFCRITSNNKAVVLRWIKE